MRSANDVPELSGGAPHGREGAPTAVIREACAQGISTRSVDDLVKTMGISGISKSQVSRLCDEIDGKVRAFLEAAAFACERCSWPESTRQRHQLVGRMGGEIRSRFADGQGIHLKARCQNPQWQVAASYRQVPRAHGVPEVLDWVARRSLWVTIVATILMITNAKAQDAEPRLYTNAPVGLNFLILGHLYSEGKIAFDPSSSITDAEFHSHTEALAYVRTLDIGGNSAKFDVILPYSTFSANGLVAGRPREREMSGLGDPRFRLSINFLGAPALSAQEFASYQQDLIVGASLQVSAPLGQYDDTKLLNLGNNRWSFRPELGISKAWGPWTVEVAPSVTIFSDNTDFFGDRTLSQSPIYALRGDIVYHFKSGVWVSLDGTYFTGGRTTVAGVRGDNEQSNARAGLTLAVPLDRQNSVKFNASTGLSTRTGSEFSLFGVAWQLRW